MFFRPRNRSGDAAFRIVVYLFFTHVGRIIMGSAFLIGGLIYGFNSHMVSYQSADVIRYQLYSNTDAVEYYIRDVNTGLIFTAKLTDFSSYFSEQDIAHARLSLVYDDSSQNVNMQLSDGGSLTGTGHQILKLVILDQQGHAVDSFDTYQYQSHPQSYFENHWSIASILAGIGACILLATLIIYLIARQHNPDEHPELSTEEIAEAYRKQTRDAWRFGLDSRGPIDFKKLTR
ncbi:hypothetical protein [Dictyobacter formicarum]|uniref:Uncharacterized protein n=1 Tax=Dictyobacter formicarum TaxID=2778368 RepID=A0ABQ3VSZ1_9CHLR|nr:hypothetical protein [Dictyobacter formicarum]GHO89060.1 hypothetical protein KSZ_70660 [Dictyobacter formicarum]